MLKKITLSLALILSVVVIAMAADLISGRWTGKLLIGSDETALTYTFATEGDKLTGKIASEQGELPLIDGKITGNNLTFKIDYNGLMIPHEGTVVGDTLKLKMTIDGNVLQGKFARAK